MNVRILRDNSQSQAGTAEAATSRIPQDAPNCSLLPLCLYLSYALFYSETKPSNSGQPRNADGSEPIMAPANDDSCLRRWIQSKKASCSNKTCLGLSSINSTSASQPLRSETLNRQNLKRSKALQPAEARVPMLKAPSAGGAFGGLLESTGIMTSWLVARHRTS